MFGYKKMKRVYEHAMVLAYLMSEAGTAIREHNFDTAREAILAKSDIFKEDRVSRSDKDNGIFYFSSVVEEFQHASFQMSFSTRAGKVEKPSLNMEASGPEYFGVQLSWLVDSDPDTVIFVRVLNGVALGKNARTLEAAFLTHSMFKNREAYMKEIYRM